jgi:AcrR family transcriptional regulator
VVKPTTPVERRRRSRLSAAERRASIVAAATEVFAEVGYQRGTMAEVARRVGVSEPVIFQNFGSKAAVFAAVLEEATARMTTAMQDRAAASGSVGAWLTEFLASEHHARVHARGTHHVLFADAMSHATEQDVKNAIRRTHRTLAQTLAGLLARGQADGSVRPDLDPQTGAWWLLSLLATRGFRAATMPDRGRLEAQVAAMTLEALMTDKQRLGPR